MNSIKHGIRSAVMVPLGIAALAVGGALATPTAAWATTYEGELCMQRIFAGPGTDITNSNRLNCSANDIRLARAVSAKDANTGVTVESCVRGQTIDLEATFEVAVTANARYDAAFFFRTDGGSNARGDGAQAQGECLVSGLRPDGDPGLDLDRDSVGDLNAGTYLVKVRFDGLVCAANAEGKLKLPNCTSWHSNSSTVANSDDVYSWKPETKSKCRCDDGFVLDVNVEEPKITVTKTARTSYVSEYLGGTVTFDVTVKNDNSIESVKIGSMADHRWWPGYDSGTAQPNEIENLLLLGSGSAPDGDTACAELADAVLGPGESLSCTFTDSVPGGQAGQNYVNVVKVVGYQESTGTPVEGEDDAMVTLANLQPEPTLTKTAIAVKSCTAEVEYSVLVYNASPSETISVDSLWDDKFGDITVKADAVLERCDISVWGKIASGDSRSCSFTALIQNDTCDFEHVNAVTAKGVDDDGQAFADAIGTATVKVQQRLNPDKAD